MKKYLRIKLRLTEEDVRDFMEELAGKMENEEVVYDYLDKFHPQQIPEYVVILTGINPDMYDCLNSWKERADYSINCITRLFEE